METARDIVDEIADLVRDAETRALHGERLSALRLILRASDLHNEFIPVIAPFSDTKNLTVRIAIIARNLCAETAAHDE